MDTLAKFFGKLFARFQSLPPSRRLAVGAVVALVVLSLAMLIKSGTGTTEREYLFGGQEFSRDEIVAIETAFGEASLSDWKVVGYRIEVPAVRKSEFLAALSAKDIQLGLAGPTEKGSFFESDRARAAREKREKELKMARVVESINEIQEVAVEYTESKSSGFPRTVEKRAAVAVKAVGGRHLDRQEVTAIQKVIVASEAGLLAEDVVVLDINAKRTYAGLNDGLEMPARSVIDVKRKLYEDRTQQQILNRLINYQGLIVEVSVQPAVANDQSAEKTQDQLVLHGIAVSIGVPSSYYERLWNKRHNVSSTPDGIRPSRLDLAEIENETLRTVEEIVGGLLNEIDLPDGRKPNIVVRTDEDFAPTDQIVQSDAERLWSALSARGQPLLLALLALAVLVAWLILSRQKRKTTGELDLTSETNEMLITARKIDDASGETAPFDSIEESDSGETSEDLQDQLSQLVQKDPDAAVDALRKWIRKVA